MVLNSIGIYRFLSRARIERALAEDLAVSGRGADVDARLSVQSGIVADIDHRIAEVDAAVEKTADRGRGKVAMAIVDGRHKNRADLVASRIKEAKTLGDFKSRRLW
jgi:hypothetical protein